MTTCRPRLRFHGLGLKRAERRASVVSVHVNVYDCVIVDVVVEVDVDECATDPGARVFLRKRQIACGFIIVNRFSMLILKLRYNI